MTETEIAQILERLDQIEKHLASIEALLELEPFAEHGQLGMPEQLAMPHQLGLSQRGMLQQPGYTTSNSPHANPLTETPASANRAACPKPG